MEMSPTERVNNPWNVVVHILTPIVDAGRFLETYRLSIQLSL